MDFSLLCPENATAGGREGDFRRIGEIARLARKPDAARLHKNAKNALYAIFPCDLIHFSS